MLPALDTNPFHVLLYGVGGYVFIRLLAIFVARERRRRQPCPNCHHMKKLHLSRPWVVDFTETSCGWSNAWSRCLCKERFK